MSSSLPVVFPTHAPATKRGAISAVIGSGFRPDTHSQNSTIIPRHARPFPRSEDVTVSVLLEATVQPSTMTNQP
eukprot:1119713-Pyramimonas_sp.AAC.1